MTEIIRRRAILLSSREIPETRLLVSIGRNLVWPGLNSLRKIVGTRA